MVRPGLLFSSAPAARKGCQLLDEIFEMFERDRDSRDGREPERRGIRGFLSRLFGDDDDDDRGLNRPRRSDAGEGTADPGRPRRELDRADLLDD